MKKKAFGLLLATMMLMSSAMPAMAKTVYYKGSAVSWDYGRRWGVYSFSSVMSSIYEHHATANTTASGWKRPGILADAQQFVGTRQATAYWNCRG